MVGEWRRLHNEELHSFHCSFNTAKLIKFRMLRWTGHVARIEEGRDAFKFSTSKPKTNEPVGSLRHRREGQTLKLQ